MLCRKGSTRKCRGSVPVYLNVYDLTPVNGYAYWLGLGVYHSGVQVHGVEYAFGAHEYPTTGIFEGEPKQCDGFSFRKSILIGWTDVSPEEVRGIMGEFSEEYKGNAYNLITKNCNHFCNDACIRLTANPIPSWVNRLARIGFFCNCLLPMSISTTRLNIRHNGREEKGDEAEKKKLRSPSNRLTSSSNSSSSSSLSPSGNAVQTSRGRSRTRRTRTRTHPPPFPLILDSPSST